MEDVWRQVTRVGFTGCRNRTQVFMRREPCLKTVHSTPTTHSVDNEGVPPHHLTKPQTRNGAPKPIMACTWGLDTGRDKKTETCQWDQVDKDRWSWSPMVLRKKRVFWVNDEYWDEWNKRMTGLTTKTKGNLKDMVLTHPTKHSLMNGNGLKF